MREPRIITSGCFDGLHAGHRLFLRELRRVFISADVALASDDYIRVVKKREPRVPYERRKDELQAIHGVSRVFPHGVDGVWPFLPAYDVLVKGRDWADKVLDKLPRGFHVCIIDSGSDAHTSDAR